MQKKTVRLTEPLLILLFFLFLEASLPGLCACIFFYTNKAGTISAGLLEKMAPFFSFI
jgi:hypothetical protein